MLKLYTYEEMEKLKENWISVKDALPPPGLEVLVYKTNKKKITALARFIRYEGCDEFIDYWWDNNYPGSGNMHTPKGVTYWRPMPSFTPKQATRYP